MNTFTFLSIRMTISHWKDAERGRWIGKDAIKKITDEHEEEGLLSSSYFSIIFHLIVNFIFL